MKLYNIQPLNLHLHHLAQTVNPYNYSIALYKIIPNTSLNTS